MVEVATNVIGYSVCEMGGALGSLNSSLSNDRVRGTASASSATLTPESSTWSSWLSTPPRPVRRIWPSPPTSSIAGGILNWINRAAVIEMIMNVMREVKKWRIHTLKYPLKETSHTPTFTAWVHALLKSLQSNARDNIKCYHHVLHRGNKYRLPGTSIRTDVDKFLTDS